jgi:branched-chain amino acid transport system substrate-binding protein
VFAQSGKLKTLDGTFELRKDGAQIGEVTPLGQLQAGEKKDELDLNVIYPAEFAGSNKAVLGK